MVSLSNTYKKVILVVEFQIYLEERKIQTRVVFTGNILRQPMCKNIDKITRKKDIRMLIQLWREVLLPHHGMTEDMFNDYMLV